MADTPLGYWRLGEATGTVAMDQLTTHNGTYANNPALSQPGALFRDPATSVGFNGTTQYVQIATDASLSTSRFSVEIWARPTGGAGVYHGVIASRNYPQGWSVYVADSGDWEFWVNSGTTMITLDGGAAPLNAWHHLVGTFDGTTATLYVDGVATAASAVTAYQPQNGNPLEIAQSEPGTNFYFPGQLEEAAVYGTALSPTQVRNHYRVGTTGTPTATPTPMPTATPTATSTPIPTATSTPTATATATQTPLPAANPIVLENQQPGTAGWQIPTAGSRLADDTSNQIKGYSLAVSVNKGSSLPFAVTVNPAQTFTIAFYRMGWYGGAGGRLMLQTPVLNGVAQPACPVVDTATLLVACSWTSSYTLSVPTTWTDGLYLAILTNAQGYQNYTPFVIRDDARQASLLYQQPVNTYQAYNDWGGKSLYTFNSTSNVRAYKVSFDRPYAGDGSGDYFGWEVYLVRWQEQQGYDVTYSTDMDAEVNPGRLRSVKGVLVPGHSEYWSKGMYDEAQGARRGRESRLPGLQRDLLAGTLRSLVERCRESGAGLVQDVRGTQSGRSDHGQQSSTDHHPVAQASGQPSRAVLDRCPVHVPDGCRVEQHGAVCGDQQHQLGLCQLRVHRGVQCRGSDRL